MTTTMTVDETKKTLVDAFAEVCGEFAGKQAREYAQGKLSDEEYEQFVHLLKKIMEPKKES